MANTISKIPFPPAAPGRMLVWRLQAAAAFPPGWAAALSGNERRRAKTMADRTARRQYLAGRIALRRILSRYTGSPPGALVFSHEPRQKPVLAPPRGAPPLHFSLAHTRGIILIALSADGPIGVDLECRGRRLRDLNGLIRRVLAPAEARALSNRPPAGRRPAFLRYWVAKEACLKAIGTGLARAPNTIAITMLGPADAVWHPGAGAASWRIKFFAPAPGCLAALAARAPAIRLMLRQFPGVEAAGA